MKTKLTKKQADILRFVKKHIKNEGMSPSAVEIAEEFDLYPNGAWQHVTALIRKGALTQKQGKMRSLRAVEGFNYYVYKQV